MKDEKQLQKIKKQLQKQRQSFYWDVVTSKLAAYINSHSRPSDITDFGLLDVSDGSGLAPSIVRRVGSKVKKLPTYYKRHGARQTYIATRTILERRLQKAGIKKFTTEKPKVVFIAHQLDTTGAPHVFIDLAADFRKFKSKMPVEFHTFNPADKVNIIALNKIGLRPKLHLSKETKFIFNKGDVVVLNTVAFAQSLKDDVYNALEQNILKQLIWFIHEDEPGLIFSVTETQRIKRLLKIGKIKIFTAAVQTRDNYMKHFGVTKGVESQIYRIDVPNKYHKVRKAQDFERLDFILPGMVSDGRKGQLPLIYAFIEFKKRYFDRDPKKYRDFSLTYIGLDTDFLSRQILRHTPKGLGEHFKYFGRMSHEDCLQQGLKANMTICYSLRECLPMFVYEGMIAGHPILRNNSSGHHEQLIDNSNGFYLDSKDFEQVISVLEKVCSNDKTSSVKLAAMSKQSYEIASSLKEITYEKMVNEIEKAFISSSAPKKAD